MDGRELQVCFQKKNEILIKLLIYAGPQTINRNIYQIIKMITTKFKILAVDKIYLSVSHSIPNGCCKYIAK